MARALLAWINDQHVGTLHEDNGIWAFAYSPQWLTHPDRFPLCPSLPLLDGLQRDGATHRPAQWYFDNLLPEEGQRTLLAKSANIDANDAFALLAHYGAESAGSVTLLPEGGFQLAGPVHPLPDPELSRRIQHMPKIPLSQEARKRMSLAGAQHKLAVIFQNDALFEPEGGTASTHILKPDHPDIAYAHSVINEWFVMSLAKRVGLDVPPVWRRYIPDPVYLIQRFDRQHSADGWHRLHSIDACQLLGLDKTYKYVAGSVERLAELADGCIVPVVARRELFRWLAFNILLGNTDAHLKNISFLVRPEGVQLAPFYDLLSTAVYDTQSFDQDRWPASTSLAWPIGSTARMANLTRDTLIAAGVTMGIKPASAGQMLDRFRRSLVSAADVLYQEVEQQNQTLAEHHPELRQTFAGELRCLRAIRSVIIDDMNQRLA